MKIFDLLKSSILDTTGRESSTRITAYLLAAIIAIYSATFLSIEVTNLVSCILNGKAYTISNEIIVVFGSILAHHIGVLFNKRKEKINTTSEVSVSKNKEVDV